MITTKKLLVTLITTVLLSICFGTTAFASELGITETQPDATITEDTNTITENQNAALLEGSSEDTEEGIAEDKYYIDEQGQVFYEEAVIEEEIVIEDVIDDETEEKTSGEKASYSEKDLRLLSGLIYSEAGNQSYEGMLAVANVVLNRAKSDVYWHVDSVKEVIYDHKWSVQFAVTIKNKSTGLSMLDKALKCYDTRKFTGGNPEAQEKALKRAIKAAKAALEGNNNIGDYLCFQNKRSASRIKSKYPDYRILGDHIFYRVK